ncbi:MAG TPA: ABC transporter ATP-binding protein [Polyangiaceae bacterium]|nr:ABC transporter ATP-binding protein [Polyangiaceae bacterium]
MAPPPFPTSLGGQFRRHAWAYAVGAVLLAAQQSLMYARDRLFKTGVDAAAAGDRDAAWETAALTMAVIAGAGVVRVLSRVVIFNGGRRAEYELRAAMLARLHTLGAGFFRTIPTGDIMSRATNDLTQVRLLLGFGVLNVINTVFAFVSALTLMFGLSARLTFAALTAAPVGVLCTRWFSRNMFARTRDNQAALGKMGDQVQASLAGVRVVRSLALEASEIERFEATNADYLTKSLALARLRGLMMPIFGLIASLSMMVVFWYGGRLVLAKELTAGEFVAFWTATGRLLWPVIALGFVASILQRGRASYERLRAIFDARPEVVDGPLAPREIEGELEVRGLTVELGGRKVLDGVTFRAPAGSSLAIVGRTGSGKSTLAALLPRLLPTPKGSVFLDGVDVCDLPVATVRRAVGYAQQDAFLFSTTVAKNVGLSLDECESDRAMAEVRAAAREAQIEAEVDGLPQGFDTVVGERGVQLSGGQRQRVALARAFLWRPKVLVLDDPLSAVDARTEAAILEAIGRQAERRTLLLITHRVAAAAQCDRVIVLDAGRVAEEGTHDELLRRGGLYATFAEEQRRAQDGGAPEGGLDPAAA